MTDTTPGPCVGGPNDGAAGGGEASHPLALPSAVGSPQDLKQFLEEAEQVAEMIFGVALVRHPVWDQAILENDSAQRLRASSVQVGIVAALPPGGVGGSR